MNKILGLLLLALTVVACNSCTTQSPPVPPAPLTADGGSAPTLDAAPAPAPVSGDPCGQADAHSTALGCPLTTPQMRTTWAGACRVDVANGIDMHAACVIGATECKVVAACVGLQ